MDRMMAYCTLEDLKKQIKEDELIQLTDDDGIEVIDEDVITQAISDADAEIDGYCATKYDDLPFSPVPTMVRKISVDITIYNLYARRRGPSESIRDRYKDAIAFLKAVANGTATLGGDAPAEDDDTGPEASTSADDRIFTMGRTSDSFVGSLDNY